VDEAGVSPCPRSRRVGGQRGPGGGVSAVAWTARGCL